MYEEALTAFTFISSMKASSVELLYRKRFEASIIRSIFCVLPSLLKNVYYVIPHYNNTILYQHSTGEYTIRYYTTKLYIAVLSYTLLLHRTVALESPSVVRCCAEIRKMYITEEFCTGAHPVSVPPYKVRREGSPMICSIPCDGVRMM